MSAGGDVVVSNEGQCEKLLPDMNHFKGGANTFINKGTNGRWRAPLTEDDHQLYEPAAVRSASPMCRSWIEEGSA